MILLADLLVTHKSVRHWDDVQQMAEFVRRGGFWTLDVLKEYAESIGSKRVSPLIQISQFEDEQFFIHDGHHRSVSTHLGARNYLRDDEYEIKAWTYAEYLEINGELNWVTPFDPRDEVRLPDFASFQKEALRRYLLLKESDSLDGFNEWVRKSASKYKTQRGNTLTVADILANSLIYV